MLKKSKWCEKDYFFCVVMLLTLVFGMVGLAERVSAETTSEDFSFSIMHTNDMHGRLAFEKDKALGLAKLKTYMESVNPTLMIDAGDAVQGLAISNFSEGKDMIKMMQLLSYDAVGIGNHEFDFGYNWAMAYKQSLPAVSANVSKNGAASFEPYKIVEKDGKKFALIGLTTPETAVKTHPRNVEGVTFADPIPVAKELISKLQNEVDAFIIIAHLGVDETTPEAWRSDALAKSLSESHPNQKIIIIDGHSHTAMPEGQRYGNVLLAQTGSYLSNVGVIEVSAKNGQIDYKAKLVPTKDLNDIAEDPEIKTLVDATKAKFENEMNTVVLKDNPVYLEGDAVYGRTRETNLGNLICDALYNYGQTAFSTPADFAVINGGGIRVSVEKGVVTKGNILAVLPFGNTISQIDITGQQIYDMFEHSLRSEAQKDESGQVILDEKGLPMLGKNGGYLQVSSSIKIIYDANLQGEDAEKGLAGQRVLQVQIRNRQTGVFEEIKRDATYKVATNDFLAAGGDGYTMLGGPREEGIAMDGIFTEFLQNIESDSNAKVVSITSGKYQLLDYATVFPYSRIIPMKKADFASGTETGTSTEKVQLVLADLESAIKICEALKEATYTKKTWDVLVEQLNVAKEVLTAAGKSDTKVTQSEIDSAKTKLLAAKEQLVVVTTAENNQGKTNSNGNLPKSGEKEDTAIFYGIGLVFAGSLFYLNKKRQAKDAA